MKEVEAEKDENNTRYNRTLVLIDFAMKKKILCQFSGSFCVLLVIVERSCYTFEYQLTERIECETKKNSMNISHHVI